MQAPRGLLSVRPTGRGLLAASAVDERPMAGPAAQMDKAGVVDYLLATVAGGLGGAAGLALDQRQNGRRAKATAAYNADIDQRAQTTGWTPTERLIFSIDPKKALELIAERTKPRETAGGNSVLMDGKFLTAPKVGIDGGYGYTQTPEGINWQAQRGMNHDELEAERHNMQGETFEGQRIEETGRHNKVSEGIDYGQLGVARGNLGVARGNLGVAQGNLGLRGQELALSRQTAIGGGKPTDAQAQAGFNASRLANANRTLSALEAKKYNAGLGALGGIGNAQAYGQAQGEWADAILRLTTGAAATKDEIANAKATYFPQLGDGADVRKQKAAARAGVMQEAMRRAGPAAPAQSVRRYNPATGNLE